MTYISYIYNKKPDWRLIPEAPISCFQWESAEKYRPFSRAKLCRVQGEGIYVLLESDETSALTKYKNRNDPVYKDSCLEVFLQLGEKGYINVETNSAGVYLCQFGKERGNRVFLNEITPLCPLVKPFKTESSWGNEIFLSDELIFSLYSFSCPDEFYGNFYKCGDETAIPHYGSFAPMGSIDRGFHNPECFAKIILRKKA